MPLGIFERVAPNHPDTLHCLNSLALIARSRGDFAQARHLWERALDVGERVFGEEHPTVAGVLNNLATLRKHMGDYPAAQALLERSLAIRERVRGPEHPEVAQALTNLAAGPDPEAAVRPGQGERRAGPGDPREGPGTGFRPGRAEPRGPRRGHSSRSEIWMAAARPTSEPWSP